ncbi:MAG: sodium-dependent transporter [Bdellovibrionales bacterium]|nr:sodium-dependent transporter [Bdellovibrionales bacterium]
MQANRAHWSSRIAFVLAATGSAIGLGNIWKFPYMAGANGGSAFVLVYLGCIALIGFPLMIAEIYIGKKSQKNTIEAFETLHHAGTFWKSAGFLGMLGCFLVLSFYSLVGGWVLDFEYQSLLHRFANESDDFVKNYFVDLIHNRQGTQIFWHSTFMLITIGIVAKGVSNGLEKWNKILMPILFSLLIFLFVYSLFLEGFKESIHFLFAADFSKLTWKSVLEAVGHAFFTLSLGMGSMIIYGSYMEKEGPVLKQAAAVVLLDTFIALLAGTIIFTIVYTFNAEPGAGPGLMFVTLPLLFKQIPGSWFVSNAFFILVFFAALTSAISILEVLSAYLIDTKKWSRIKATFLVGGAMWICGVLCAYPKLIIFGKNNVFDVFDILSSKITMPLTGIMISIFFGWVLGPKAIEEAVGIRSKFLLQGLVWVVRVIAPICVAVMLYKGILEVF